MNADDTSHTDTAALTAGNHRHPRLDNLTCSRKEGWRRYVETASPEPPNRLTRRDVNALPDGAAADYNRQRRRWHANLGTIKTPQLAALHENLWDIVDSNAQDGDKAKGAIAIDAFPGLGKSSAVLAFAKQFHLRETRFAGTTTDSGNERWPVCRVGLTGNTGIKEFNRAMLEFFAHPGRTRGTAADYARRALDCVLSCEVQLLIIDDLHFLNVRNGAGVAVSNHFKYIANEFPVTMIFIGVGLASSGLLSEGSRYSDAVLAQTGRRTTLLGMEPFMVRDEHGRREWRQLLATIDSKLRLAEHRQGMVADDLCEYLFVRSTGHIGSLMTLIDRGCQRAMRTGTEKLTQELLNEIPNDVASERARHELQTAIDTGRLRVRRKPRQPPGRRKNAG
ncbi:AAA family ATPase [Mycobacteroides abscessus]|uniref:AAA family ATPase n=1 Tax=Mycobacteroides abscessus TaxID=36809 RepID=UPI00092670CE|nr:TniB family NTP-binding protein [Mycobacteroides abscessus]SHX65070.1 ATP binding protein with TniB domain [Mycobacteroides abscessus subsp. abscessus]SHY16073.1 ATP binding protein with TniB domain [Mycobacteroides abscessus subsp. abscessus]SIB55223.1 ATP binding protein with TniB domain [Mycobacteroides abscessus subsp. abscessus]SIB94720.1 ATP binding protein with TniB domain [Mycobacteroides abscessus subsp. abscessus]SIC80718.1 ATP binding protein with TniB domain [Mycobacteroides abs